MAGVKFGFLTLGPVPDIRREEQTSTKEIKIRRGGGITERVWKRVRGECFRQRRREMKRKWWRKE